MTQQEQDQEQEHTTLPSFYSIFCKIVRRKPLVLVFMIMLVVIILLGIMLGFRQCSSSAAELDYSTSGEAPIESYHRLDSIVLKSVGKAYGLLVDDYKVEQGEIESGETFSRLLNQRYNVNISIINRLIALSEGKFDLRDIRAGQTYTAFITPDSSQTLCHLVYERNKTDYVTFSLCDSIYVREDKKEVFSEERYSEGVINSSLYETIYSNDLHPQLADKLSRIFQFTIDFFALQKGDKFRVVYEEHFIDTTCIGIGEIYGVEFIHAKKSIWAYRFMQDGNWGYWDDKSVNLKKSLLMSPLKFSHRVSSRYGMRIHPIRRIRSKHNGVDYACPTGTPVLSVADGVVTRRGWDPGGGGNRLWIKHPQGYESAYLHLSRFAVKQGQRVRQGQVIAYSGNTGGSTGPHLDYRLKKNGRYVNPQTNTSTPSTPIKSGNKANFEKMKSDVQKVIKEYEQKQNS